jgi:hypothetical protein
MLPNFLKAMKELDGIEETRTFSTVSADDLKEAGVKMNFLSFVDAEVANLTKRLSTDAEAQIADLHTRIKEIYACVNLDNEPGSRMILDAVLLTVRKLASTQPRDIAIIPEMSLSPPEGVRISDPNSGYGLRLTGKVDYVVMEYENVRANKARVVGPGGSREESLRFAKGQLLLVQAKRLGLGQTFIESVPEAVSQAITLLECANLPEVRFCLSDGESWCFLILKSENDTLTFYESAIRCLSSESDLPLREIVQLICEWLKPSVTGLFKFR